MTFTGILWPPLAFTDIPNHVREHDVYRYVSYLHHHGVDLTVDIKTMLSPGSFHEAHVDGASLADVHLEFWSKEFVKSYYCMCEVTFAMLLHHKIVIILFLDDEAEVRTVLKTMPGNELLFAKLSHLSPSVDDTYKQSYNIFAVPTVSRSFASVSSTVMKILQHLEKTRIFSSSPRLPSTAILTNVGPAHGIASDSKPSSNINQGTDVGVGVTHNVIEGDNDTSSIPVSVPLPVPAPLDILVSYAWTNSHDACDRGQVMRHEGYTDPRQLKADIEASTGYRCWLDVEQVGLDGLYEGIHKACDQVQLVLLCVSDEYCRSPNCLMELEYCIRRKPCVLACVGSGYAWRSSVAGYFTAYQRTFDFVQNTYPQSLVGRETFELLIDHIQRVLEPPLTSAVKGKDTALR